MACRPVCWYWEKQCRRTVFRAIKLKSEKMVFDLVHRFKHNPAWQHIPPLFEWVDLPKYTAETKVPWLHLLDPRWKRSDLVIKGPFPGRRTLRSIHFGLSRSLPRSFSRGFTCVHLYDVRFDRFEDTTCLASELSHLERLVFSKVSWDSLPTEVPLRRPRANLNKLAEVWLENCSVSGVESPSFAFAAWTLVLGVSRPSPLDDLGATHALVQAVPASGLLTVTVERDCEGRVSGLDIENHFVPVFALRFRFEQPTGKHPLFVFLDYRNFHSDSPLWPQRKSAIAILPRSWHLHLLFGFASRKDMVRYAADVVSSLVGPSKARYAISQKEKREGDFVKEKYWYEATLDSEKLKGKGVNDPSDVYADWKKIFQLPKQVQSGRQSNAA